MSLIKTEDLSRHIHNPQRHFGFICREFDGTDYTLRGLVCGGVLELYCTYIKTMTAYGHKLYVRNLDTYLCGNCGKFFIQTDGRSISPFKGDLENHKNVSELLKRVELAIYGISKRSPYIEWGRTGCEASGCYFSIDYNCGVDLTLHYGDGETKLYQLLK